MLQQAIERVGKVDRAAVIKEIQTGSSTRSSARSRLTDNLRKDIWRVGQWQGGEFYGVAPASHRRAPRPCSSRSPAVEERQSMLNAMAR